MFASGTGSMRGPQVKTPLLLLLLLLTSLSQTVLCEDYDEGGETEPETTPNPNDYGNSEISETTTESEIVSDNPPDPSPTGEFTETPIEEEQGSGLSHAFPVDASADPSVDPSSDSTAGPDEEVLEEEGLSVIIILIPVVLVVLIIAMIVCGIFISRRWNKKARNQELRKEDPYLDGSSTEKVPMPMFEDDVPSVLEMEMEEFDQWMKNEGETAENSNIS